MLKWIEGNYGFTYLRFPAGIQVACGYQKGEYQANLNTNGALIARGQNRDEVQKAAEVWMGRLFAKGTELLKPEDTGGLAL